MSTDLSSSRRASPWASGLIVFAGGLLAVAGVFQIFVGTAALAHDTLYDGAPRYVFAFDLTVWGWVQLLTGVLSVAAGLAALRGQTWARVVGIGLAGLSMVVQFMFLPHYPAWSSVVIALDVMVVWALATYSPDAAAEGGPGAGTRR
ncbi:DUF7144 family membrane protein [Pseudonocardia pini]|uniref:DUF7144 family membrane protein n=1 Tax=Pseudonocardia pini TaxID=2758030 RepID=UPI0015EFDE20|nr:hypothetical protein [Pseudonocardia pini]